MLSRVAPWLASHKDGAAPGGRRPDPGRLGHLPQLRDLAPAGSGRQRLYPGPPGVRRYGRAHPRRRQHPGRVRRRHPGRRLLGGRQPGSGPAGPRVCRAWRSPRTAPGRRYASDLRPGRRGPCPVRGLEQLGHAAHEVRDGPAADDDLPGRRPWSRTRSWASASWPTLTGSFPPARPCSKRKWATRRTWAAGSSTAAGWRA